MQGRKAYPRALGKKFLILSGPSVTSLSVSYPWRTDNQILVSKAPAE